MRTVTSRRLSHPVGVSALTRAAGVAIAILAAGLSLSAAALFNPWRRRLQSFMDRRFYRRKYDAARILAAFSGRLRDEVDLDRLASNLAQVVADTVQPAGIALWLSGTGRETS